MIRSLVCCAAVLLLVGMRTREVADVRWEERIVPTKGPGQGPVHSLAVVGAGRIEGEARVTQFLGGRPYKSEPVSGEVAFRWSGDWYSDRAEIQYLPEVVTGGHLELEYRFN